MANDYFRFKQFTVHQVHCAMKVGTDGVLLGALCQPPLAEGDMRVLDVGTGTGLIAMMVAQRFASAFVDAIDIDERAVAQARENIAASPFADRAKAWLGDFADAMTGVDDSCVGWRENRYDLIVSNPPFFKEDTSCPDARRDAARRESSLPFDSLIANSASLLTTEGRLYVIIPASAASDFIMQCAMHCLYLLERIDVKTTPRKEARRVVLGFCQQPLPSSRRVLLLQNADGSISEDYSTLTRDFYLDK